MKQRSLQSGFTLIEMLVSLMLFAIVVLIAVGALLSLVAANQKAQALQSVINNLNVSLDGMVRNIRSGVDYGCPAMGSSCPAGDTTFTFTDHNKQTVTYRYNANSIERQIGTGNDFVKITAPEVTITKMKFYLVGQARDDGIQPKVVMVVIGTAGSSFTKTKTTFHIQATAVQRIIDL